MELGEAEALGVLDDHDGGVGDVDADFDDGGGNQDLDFVFAASPWCPAATSRRRNSQTPGRCCWVVMRVMMGVRPGGSSSRTETSRSPYRVSERVRGMGVAVSTRTCGAWPRAAALSIRRLRWRTPKRCCSSMATKPRRANATLSSMSA